MTGKQHAVLWLGLILIITRLFTTNQWSTIWQAISTNVSGAVSGNPGGSKGSSHSLLPSGGIPIPLLPGGNLHIPLPHLSAAQHPTRGTTVV